MLIVAGEIKVASADDYGKAKDILANMMAETHKEEGCHAYSFAQDAADPGSIRLFEIWENQEALDAHMKTPHMAAFNKAVAGFNVTGASVNIYEVSGTRKLM